MKTSNKNSFYNKTQSSEQLYYNTQFNNKISETKKLSKIQEVSINLFI